jgi:hypothetical protein
LGQLKELNILKYIYHLSKMLSQTQDAVEDYWTSECYLLVCSLLCQLCRSTMYTN